MGVEGGHRAGVGLLAVLGVWAMMKHSQEGGTASCCTACHCQGGGWPGRHWRHDATVLVRGSGTGCDWWTTGIGADSRNKGMGDWPDTQAGWPLLVPV